MKAVGFTEFGGPEVLQVLELPVPDASPGEVRIRVSAATVNAVDALQRSDPPDLPTPGRRSFPAWKPPASWIR